MSRVRREYRYVNADEQEGFVQVSFGPWGGELGATWDDVPKPGARDDHLPAPPKPRTIDGRPPARRAACGLHPSDYTEAEFNRELDRVEEQCDDLRVELGQVKAERDALIADREAALNAYRASGEGENG